MDDSTNQQTCPMCGEPVSADAEVCSACGERFTEQQPLTHSERYILRRFQNQMNILAFVWYMLGGILTVFTGSVWIIAISDSELPGYVYFVRNPFLGILLCVGVTAFGIFLLLTAWGCRHQPQWSLYASLMIGYTVLGCNLLLLVAFVNVCGFLLVVPILVLSHIALRTSHQVKAEGIALDDKR